MGAAIFVLVVVVLVFMWRRRAGRRTAKATEAIAGFLAPIPGPGGRYPRPVRGRHRANPLLGVVEVTDRLCLGCGRITGDRVAGVGRVLFFDLCASCEMARDRLAR